MPQVCTGTPDTGSAWWAQPCSPAPCMPSSLPVIHRAKVQRGDHEACCEQESMHVPYLATPTPPARDSHCTVASLIWCLGKASNLPHFHLPILAESFSQKRISDDVRSKP